MCFTGDGVSVLQDEKYSKMDGGDTNNSNTLKATEPHT